MSKDYEKIVEDALNIAILARIATISPTQIFNIQEVLLTEGNDKNCLLITSIYLLRQSQKIRIELKADKKIKKELNRNKLLKNRLENLESQVKKYIFNFYYEYSKKFYEMYKENKKRNDGLIFSGLVRWLYETLPEMPYIKKFEDIEKCNMYINKLKKIKTLKNLYETLAV